MIARTTVSERSWRPLGSGPSRRSRWLRSTLSNMGLLILCTTFLWGIPADAAPEPLRIVFIAYQNPNQLVEDVRPVVAYLEERLQRKVEYFTATDYAAVVEALRNETADVGFMGPLQYLLAHEHAGARPILGEIYNGSSTYHSRIFVRKDSGIRNLKDLKGKNFAFVDPISSSGYLYPLEIFVEAGLIENRDQTDRFFRRNYFAGGDEQAIRAVLNGFVDAAGIGQYSFSLLRGEERDQVISIADSKPIPSHCVVVRKGLEGAAANSLRDSLLALNEGENRPLLKYLYNVDGYVEVDHQTFAGTEELARKHGFLPALEPSPSEEPASKLDSSGQRK
ncbi:MAG: phosphate/phosphite/phosphonate ABC transporter substrate-binding protein [Deltaproteobacteria bacterium]|nr:phosphate/phosphite/phosphonate ABC transporter substrate-binding protein [Deltaproteobacteria bacterium]